jgi:putative chitinase
MDKTKFYASVRAGILGPKLEDNEVQGCEAILAAMEGASIAHCAYALATAYHETARTMQPVREAYWLSEDWRRRNLRYWPWYGRGYVQLTWQSNYARADREATAAGLIKAGELLANADLAMRMDLAAFIMRAGMDEGWFSAGNTLDKHLPTPLGTLPQFTTARRIINGTDKAGSIAAYAIEFQNALVDGGWA